MGCDNSYWTLTYDDRSEPPKTPPYAVHVTAVTVDYAQSDEWANGDKTQGKQVDTETKVLRWDTLDEAMKCAEAHTPFRRVLSPDGTSIFQDIHTTYQVEIHRNGLPLFYYDGKRWSALGDDYLDPADLGELVDCNDWGLQNVEDNPRPDHKPVNRPHWYDTWWM